MALKMEDGGQERTSGQPVKVEKGKEVDFPLNPPEQLPRRHLDVGQMRLLAHGSKREIICVVLSLYAHGNFLQQQ